MSERRQSSLPPSFEPMPFHFLSFLSFSLCQSPGNVHVGKEKQPKRPGLKRDILWLSLSLSLFHPNSSLPLFSDPHLPPPASSSPPPSLPPLTHLALTFKNCLSKNTPTQKTKHTQYALKDPEPEKQAIVLSKCGERGVKKRGMVEIQEQRNWNREGEKINQ